MKKTISISKILPVVICLVLTAAMALTMTACGNPADDSSGKSSPTSSGTPASSDSEKDAVKVIGEGKTSFNLKVTDKDGKTTEFTVNTDKKTVGDALLELELIEGENSEYGLYIKTVNGITADYNTDQTYWAFYINGEYATAGVDTTDIVAGETYELKVQK